MPSCGIVWYRPYSSPSEFFNNKVHSYNDISRLISNNPERVIGLSNAIESFIDNERFDTIDSSFVNNMIMSKNPHCDSIVSKYIKHQIDKIATEGLSKQSDCWALWTELPYIKNQYKLGKVTESAATIYNNALHNIADRCAANLTYLDSTEIDRVTSKFGTEITYESMLNWDNNSIRDSIVKSDPMAANIGDIIFNLSNNELPELVMESLLFEKENIYNKIVETVKNPYVDIEILEQIYLDIPDSFNNPNEFVDSCVKSYIMRAYGFSPQVYQWIISKLYSNNLLKCANVINIDEAIDTIASAIIDRENILSYKATESIEDDFNPDVILESVSKYTIDTLPDIMYFSSKNKHDKLVGNNGKLFLSPYMGISSIFIIDVKDDIANHYKSKNGKLPKRMSFNTSYKEWEYGNGIDLTKPLKTVHITHNIPSMTDKIYGTSSGYIHAVDVSNIKDQLKLFVTNDPDREVIYTGKKSLKPIKIIPHTINWELEFSGKNANAHGNGILESAGILTSAIIDRENILSYKATESIENDIALHNAYGFNTMHPGMNHHDAVIQYQWLNRAYNNILGRTDEDSSNINDVIEEKINDLKKYLEKLNWCARTNFQFTQWTDYGSPDVIDENIDESQETTVEDMMKHAETIKEAATESNDDTEASTNNNGPTKTGTYAAGANQEKEDSKEYHERAEKNNVTDAKSRNKRLLSEAKFKRQTSNVTLAYSQYKRNAQDADLKITNALKDFLNTVTVGSNSKEMRREIIEGKTYSVTKLLKTFLGGYLVFCSTKIGFILLLIVRACRKGKVRRSEKKKIIMELEGELSLIEEKIRDASADCNNPNPEEAKAARAAKYSLMRTKANLENAIKRIKMNTEMDKYSAGSARNVTVNDQRA